MPMRPCSRDTAFILKGTEKSPDGKHLVQSRSQVCHAPLSSHCPSETHLLWITPENIIPAADQQKPGWKKTAEFQTIIKGCWRQHFSSQKHWKVSQEKEWKEYCFNHSDKAQKMHTRQKFALANVGYQKAGSQFSRQQMQAVCGRGKPISHRKPGLHVISRPHPEELGLTLAFRERYGWWWNNSWLLQCLVPTGSSAPTYTSSLTQVWPPIFSCAFFFFFSK